MIVYLLFLFLNITWLVIILAAPYFIANTQNNFLNELYYGLFSLICHQIPERSFFLNGCQLPVCARCLGIYFGIFAGGLLYPFFKKLDNEKVPGLKILIPFLSILIIDGFLQTLHLYKTSNEARFLVGFISVLPLAFYILPLLNGLQKYLTQNKGQNALK